MLRYAAFALGTTVAIGLPQLSMAQTVGTFPQAPVVTVQETIVPTPRSVVLVAEPVVAVRQPVAPLSRAAIAGTARDTECYTPDVDGPSNTRALPLCAGYLDQAAGGEQYETIDRLALADTRVCPAGVNCGPPADLTNIRPFYGSSGAVAPAPAPVAQPVAVARVVAVPPPPPPPVVLAPPPPVPVPVAALPSVGFGGAGLAAAGALGLAAIIGVAALASDDDDDAASTTGTR